jgi:hypothetical protein
MNFSRSSSLPAFFAPAAGRVAQRTVGDGKGKTDKKTRETYWMSSSPVYKCRGWHNDNKQPSGEDIKSEKNMALRCKIVYGKRAEIHVAFRLGGKGRDSKITEDTEYGGNGIDYSIGITAEYPEGFNSREYKDRKIFAGTLELKARGSCSNGKESCCSGHGRAVSEFDRLPF